LSKWKCYRCGYVTEAETPPDVCPECSAPVSFWIDWSEAITPLDEPVSKYMRRELFTIDLNRSAWDAARMMKEKKVGSLVVTNDGRAVGIVTERDMLYKVVAEDLPAAHVLLRKVMSSPIVSVTTDTPIREAIEIMNSKNFRRLLVTDKGEPVGLISMRSIFTDALKAPPPERQTEAVID
jgi:CBS domain-containing protein